MGAAPALLPRGPRLLGRQQRGLLRVVAPGGGGASGLYRSSSRGGRRSPEVVPSRSSPGDGGALWSQPSATPAWGTRGALAAGRPSPTFLMHTLPCGPADGKSRDGGARVTLFDCTGNCLCWQSPSPSYHSHHNPVDLCPLAAYLQLSNLRQREGRLPGF